MAKVIETEGSKAWLSALRSRFKLEHTRMVESDEAISIFLKEDITANVNVMVGRYCKSTGIGVIMDRRSKER